MRPSLAGLNIEGTGGTDPGEIAFFLMKWERCICQILDRGASICGAVPQEGSGLFGGVQFLNLSRFVYAGWAPLLASCQLGESEKWN